MGKNMNINGYNITIEEKSSNIFGLLYEPQMVDFSNDDDWLPFTKQRSVEVSKRSFDLVDNICKEYMTHGILEIGVSRNGEGSFTNALLKNKPTHIKYLGVDLENKKYLNNFSANIFTMQVKSDNQNNIRNRLNQLGINKLSILFIDGWHSLNAIINDWKYTDLLSDKSIVFLHDTNGHPGPTILVEAINRDIFNVQKYFENEDDYGLTVAIKK